MAVAMSQLVLKCPCAHVRCRFHLLQCVAFPGGNCWLDRMQVSWDIKGQLQTLRRSRQHRKWLQLGDPLVDVRIAAWLSTPNDYNADPAVRF